MQGRAWLRLEVRGRAREERNSSREGLGGGRGEGTQSSEFRVYPRTLNIVSMLLMLKRLKSTGWLKFFAFCRVAREVYTKRGEVWAWR